MKTIIREANTLLVKAGAEYSPCERFRYRLWRIWDADKKPCAFIGLNPSTATEVVSDNTVTRCIRFSEAWGYGGLFMLNIFAFRATQPKDMYACEEPIGGPRNDAAILETVAQCGMVVAAWGNHGMHLNRGQAVRAMIPELCALRVTGRGCPQHPLYLPASLQPTPWAG